MTSTGERISSERVTRIAQAALSAPSGDNCQPWSFRWDGDELTVFHDAGRAAHVINHHHHGSLLTLGRVLEAMTIAAAAERFTAEARLAAQIERPEEGSPWLSVRFAAVESEAGDDAGELSGAIHGRRTDRRLFRGGSVSHPVFTAMRSAAAGRRGCGLHVINAPSRELTDYIAEADAYVWRQEDVYRDVMR